MSRTTGIAPWQVRWVDLGSPVGNEQGGIRPAVIVSSETHCRFPIDMALVVPLTTRDRGLPHHVLIDTPQSGLGQGSWARTDDIRAVSAARFTSTDPLGRLSEAEAEQVHRWVHRMLA